MGIFDLIKIPFRRNTDHFAAFNKFVECYERKLAISKEVANRLSQKILPIDTRDYFRALQVANHAVANSLKRLYDERSHQANRFNAKFMEMGSARFGQDISQRNDMKQFSDFVGLILEQVRIQTGILNNPTGTINSKERQENLLASLQKEIEAYKAVKANIVKFLKEYKDIKDSGVHI